MLSNAQYARIMGIYEQRRVINRRRKEKRIQEIYEEIPELLAIDERIAKEAAGEIKRKLNKLPGSGEEKDHLPDDGKALRHDLHRKRIALLNSHGLTEEDLEDEYECPICRDTGFVDGKKCRCFIQLSIDLFSTGQSWAYVLGDDSFDTFDLSLYSEDDISALTSLSALDSAKEALRKARDFAGGFSKDSGNMLIYGAVGVGKTFLTHCIAREVLSEGHSVVYNTAAQMFEVIADEAFKREGDFGDIRQAYGQLFSCDLLIIDDLGTEYTNSFLISQLFRIINERQIQKRSVIISTNLDLEEIEKTYTERIFSRIIKDYAIIHMSGEDIRVQRRLNTNERR